MTHEEQLICYIRGRFDIDYTNIATMLGYLDGSLNHLEDPTLRAFPSGLRDKAYRRCITHGTRHGLEDACLAGLTAWADARGLSNGTDMDLFIVLGSPDYHQAWEKAVVRIASETGECVECARTGMACLECDPPNDVDMPEPTEPDFDDYS